MREIRTASHISSRAAALVPASVERRSSQPRTPQRQLALGLDRAQPLDVGLSPGTGSYRDLGTRSCSISRVSMRFRDNLSCFGVLFPDHLDRLALTFGVHEGRDETPLGGRVAPIPDAVFYFLAHRVLPVAALLRGLQRLNTDTN